MKKTLKWRLAQEVELRWWQKYLGGKDVGVYHAWKRGYWLNLIQQIEPECLVEAGSKVLDAGCGPAGIFMALNGCNVDAVDPLMQEYENNLSVFKREDYPYTRFYSLPIEQYQPDCQYDIVFCLNAINHVNDLERCYNLLTSWVKPGGKLVVSIDAHNHAFFKHLFRLIPGDVLHPHQYDEAEYGSFLESRGLQINKTVCLKKEFFFSHYVQVASKDV